MVLFTEMRENIGEGRQKEQICWGENSYAWHMLKPDVHPSENVIWSFKNLNLGFRRELQAGDKNWGLTSIMSIVMRSLNGKYTKRSLWS